MRVARPRTRHRVPGSLPGKFEEPQIAHAIVGCDIEFLDPQLPDITHEINLGLGHEISYRLVLLNCREKPEPTRVG